MIAAEATRHFTYMGLTVNEYRADTGAGIARHEHEHAHLTLCVQGKCLVRKEGREIVLDCTSKPVELRGREWHEIEAVEDGTVFLNVFAAGRL
jgi:quercetin dioxygenase-like cupin family protein